MIDASSGAGACAVGAAMLTGVSAFGFSITAWVGSKPAVRGSVSDSGQFERAQLGPAALRSIPSNQRCHCGSTLRGVGGEAGVQRLEVSGAHAFQQIEGSSSRAMAGLVQDTLSEGPAI
jgi:hypothetical protein